MSGTMIDRGCWKYQAWSGLTQSLQSSGCMLMKRYTEAKESLLGTHQIE